MPSATNLGKSNSFIPVSNQPTDSPTGQPSTSDTHSTILPTVYFSGLAQKVETFLSDGDRQNGFIKKVFPIAFISVLIGYVLLRKDKIMYIRSYRLRLANKRGTHPQARVEQGDTDSTRNDFELENVEAQRSGSVVESTRDDFPVNNTKFWKMVVKELGIVVALISSTYTIVSIVAKYV